MLTFHICWQGRDVPAFCGLATAAYAYGYAYASCDETI